MISNSLNLNHLRLFAAVYRTGSMTSAADELHMTQSGISQHIKSLEEALEIKLFERVKQKLVPTSAASVLYKRSVESLYGLEEALLEIKGREKFLSGEVRIGVPIEFGNNVVLPLLSKFGCEHPLVRFKISYGYATAMNESLLKGELDFAFVDSYGLDKRIVSDVVYNEVLELCASPSTVKKTNKEDRKYFESLNYVDYQEGEPLLRMWFEHHLKSKNIKLQVKATLMDVQGVARLIQTGMGAGILPGYLVAKLEKEGQKIKKFSGCGKPLKNVIGIARLRDTTPNPVCTMALDFLMKSLKTK